MQYYSKSRLGEVELASSAFGQAMAVTPLQVCTAISAAVNGGYLVMVENLIFPLCGLLCLMLILSGIMASAISKRIVKPINELDLESPEENRIYEELSPLLSKIHRQNREIQNQLELAKQQQEEFSLITENMQEGLIVIDKYTMILSANSSAWNLFRVDKVCQGESVYCLDRAEDFRHAIEQVLSGEHAELILKLNGSDIQLIANPVVRGQKTEGAVILLVNVTEKLERENLRREFSANVSHELKTPLTSISGFAEIMQGGLVKCEDIPKFAGRIYKESQRLFATMGMKIVLSGTDSLGFWLAMDEELYDRAKPIHTTFIPYREYSRLLGIDSIDEYIRYGGTLRAGELAFDDEDVNAQDASFRDDESTRRYIDTAICKNIQHSLACYESGGHFRHLYSLYEAGELTSAINRIIEDMNHRFLISVLTDDFLSHDLRLTAANLRKERDPEKRTEALDAIDTEAVTQRLMELLDIRNKEEQSIGITTAHIIEIKQYLAALELIVDCPIESADPGIEPVEHILFTQPGMRYCQAQALVHSLLKDEQFSALSEYDKMQITGRILEEVRGRMMEDIVLLETMKAADKDHRVFKLQFEAGEFDMVIYDQKENSCEIFEIKHSSKQVPLQYRHLVDEDKCQRTERRFGPIHGRYILYRGEDAQMENGVQYWNVENYLKALPTLDIVQVQEIGMQPIEPTL